MNIAAILGVIIVASFLIASVLAFISGLLYDDWTGKLVAPVLFVWPLLWIYAVVFPNELEIRQLLARVAFAILAVALLVWRAGVLWLQKGRKWKL